MPRPPVLAAFPVMLMLAAAPAVLAPSAARAQASSALTTTFIAKAAATDAFELEAGRLAQDRSKDPDVRGFGAMMVTDHTKTTNALRQVLVKNNLPMPSGPSPDPTQAKLLADMRAAPADKFDQAYAHSQVVAHRTALALMEEYAARGANADLKKLAADTAPVVQHHLDMAMKLEAEAGGAPKSVGRKLD